MNDLYRPMFLPDLLVAALERNRDRPAVFIDGDVLTAAHFRDEISRYVQAFRDQGIVQGDGVATLSKNRPEVLCSMGAVMVGGCRNTPLHPLGSLDDHAYVVEDAEISTLIFDPSFAARGERAARARARAEATAVVRADRRERRPRGAGGVVRAGASRRAAGRCGGPVGARLHGRHDRQPQGRDEHVPGERDHGADHGVGVAVARRGSPPGLYAAQPRRLVALRAAAPARRFDVRAPGVRSGRGAGGDRTRADHHDHARPVDDLRAARPPEVRRHRPVEPADDLLRRVADVADPAAGGDPEDGADLLPVLRPDREPAVGVHPAQGGARPRRPRPAGDLRPAGPVGPGGAPRRRRQRGGEG